MNIHRVFRAKTIVVEDEDRPMKTVLIVDDDRLYRTVLSRILSTEYITLEASNGREALDILDQHANEVSAVMLDIVMPLMDGYEFLRHLREDARFENLPVLVASSNQDNESEKVALKLGAWDFVSKPYDPEIIRFRLKNAIERSQLSAYERIKYLAEFDVLTGIYNKSKFFMKTVELLHLYKEKQFAFIRCDIDRFKLINTFYGTESGDQLLKFMARKVEEFALKFEHHTYGRIEGDTFAFCVPYDYEAILEGISEINESLECYDTNYNIIASYGIYIIDDYEIPVDFMLDRASLAAKKGKGNYTHTIEFYDNYLSEELFREQEITNTMNSALEDGQFVVYIQPKYDLGTKEPVGGEALVRWKLPDGKMNSPGEFIPIFEKNGFITKLDLYIWERVCIIMRQWLDQGKRVEPISVNISRVDLYNPKLADTLIHLTEKYNIPPKLFNLEITESAYIDNPDVMCNVMMKLQRKGFVIMMDDFGSGYSSLNILKDINVDVLKIDMKFLSKTAIPGRGENIVASVVRMAKWLNIPVIAEGVESKEQADFLHSIGCEYCQGYYFAKPMPVDEYEKLFEETGAIEEQQQETSHFKADSLWTLTPEMEFLFNSVPQAICIYEFDGENIDLIRTNKTFDEVIGIENFYFNKNNIFSMCHEDYRAKLLRAFNKVVANQKTTECEYKRRRTDGSWIWIDCKLKYVSTVGDKHLIFANLMDITVQKEIDEQLQKFKEVAVNKDDGPETILVVDDMAIGRLALKNALQDDFEILEACNGKDALRVLEENSNKVDLILLDLVMPEMDGKEFLRHQNSIESIKNIPVIIITSEAREEEQVKLLEIGAADYIIKPFVNEILKKRVQNVLESNRKLKLSVFDDNSQSTRIDLLKGIYTSAAAVKMISSILAQPTQEKHALILLDVDDFKKINMKYGHLRGNEILSQTGKILVDTFGGSGTVARTEDDEFLIFVENITSVDNLLKQCRNISEEVKSISFRDGTNEINTSCSLGISISPQHGMIFLELYKNARNALVYAKKRGQNQCVVYDRKLFESK